MEINHALVFVFYDKTKRKFLLEKRIKGQFLAEEEIFPGGKVESSELNDFSKTLKRECLEEFGVLPLEYYKLEKPVLGESGYKLWPCVIVRWNGLIPSKVKDKGSLLYWEDLERYKSDVKSQMEVSRKVKTFMSKHGI